MLAFARANPSYFIMIVALPGVAEHQADFFSFAALYPLT
jgi:hypothetical protein